MTATISHIKHWILHNKWLRVAYVIVGILLYTSLFFGQSTFMTTAYTYSLIAIFCFLFLKKINASANTLLVVYSLVISLFVAEFTLRFIIKYPLSYGEQNGKSYIITDRYTRRSNIRFKYFKGRKDLYTLEFDSGEIRDNDCLDYQYPDDTCNALGLRGALPDGTKNILLVMGDSFAEGAGAPADSSIPALLRKYIVEHDSSTDVLNAGIPGNDIFFDWQMLLKMKRKYKIRQVVFLLNTTDINDVASRGGSERFLPNGSLEYKKSVWWEPIYAVSFVFRLYIDNALKLDYNLQTPSQHEQAYNEAITKISSLVKNEIRPWAIKNNIKVFIVMHPLSYEIGVSKRSNQYNKLLHSIQGIGDIVVLDCMPAFADTNPDQVYWKNDLHFKPVGYNMITEFIIKNIYANPHESSKN